MEVKTKQKKLQTKLLPSWSVHLSWKKDMINVRWEGGGRILRMDKSIIKVINTREGITEKVTFSQSGCGGECIQIKAKGQRWGDCGIKKQEEADGGNKVCKEKQETR